MKTHYTGYTIHLGKFEQIENTFSYIYKTIVLLKEIFVLKFKEKNRYNIMSVFSNADPLYSS